MQCWRCMFWGDRKEDGTKEGGQLYGRPPEAGSTVGPLLDFEKSSPMGESWWIRHDRVRNDQMLKMK